MIRNVYMSIVDKSFSEIKKEIVLIIQTISFFLYLFCQCEIQLFSFQICLHYFDCYRIS